MSNLFLDRLPTDIRGRIIARSEPVPLPIRTVMFSPAAVPRYIHFITSGIASVVTTMLNGDGIEVGLVGPEGVPEILHLLGNAPGTTDCFIQVAATGIRMDFRRFEQDFWPLDAVRILTLRHIQYSNLIMGQIAACNRLHEVEERLARWLLMVADRIGQDHFNLTQEFLSQMVGSRRSTVTIAAGILKRSSLITYSRREIHIVDRSGLEAAACECYPITRKLLQNLVA